MIKIWYKTYVYKNNKSYYLTINDNQFGSVMFSMNEVKTELLKYGVEV